MIRKHASRIYTLDDYVAAGSLSIEQRHAIITAIAEERNIVIAGRMGCGKTTFLNACMHEAARIRPSYRCVIVQDRTELKAAARDHVYLFARVEQGRYTAGSLSRYVYDFPDLLEDALRTDAQYLVWGELRDGMSALGLLMALNTGTRGFLTTIHADSAADTLARLEDLLASVGRTPIPRMIARFVDVIVHMDRDAATGRRFVNQLLGVEGVDPNGQYNFISVDRLDKRQKGVRI
jgi:type IV secretion system protein VirB11